MCKHSTGSSLELSAFLCLNDKLVTVKCLKRQNIYISLKMAMNLTKNVLGFFAKKKAYKNSLTKLQENLVPWKQH